MFRTVAFYFRLACSHLNRNLKFVLPYGIMNIVVIAMFYMMYAMSIDAGLEKIPGTEALKAMLGFGVWVIGIFSTIIILYTNSFLMKRRKKELGLYNILGMGKKHIAGILVAETLTVSATCIAGGWITGIVFSKLCYLLLLKLLRFPVGFLMETSVRALGLTGAVFVLIFATALLISLAQVHLSNPMALFKGSDVGEREPKSRWALAIIGLLALLAGYYISITVKAPLQALFQFFIAVLLVMLGTYLLFTAGSIVLLKQLRRNKAYYYTPEHFYAVSGMLYRMKQNAAGLSNICILSAMVIVTLSTTVSLFAGLEDALNTRLPMSIMVNLENPENIRMHAAEQLISNAGKRVRADVRTMQFLEGTELYGYFESNQIRLMKTPYYDDRMVLITLMDQQAYMQSDAKEGKRYILENGIEENRCVIIATEALKSEIREALQLGNRRLDIQTVIGSEGLPRLLSDHLVQQMVIVFQNPEAVRTFLSSVDSQAKQVRFVKGGVDLRGDERTEMLMHQEIQRQFKAAAPKVEISSRAALRESFVTFYGGFMFLGIFLGLIFLLTAVLILYFKQITEGYEDQGRYEMMQKVGMTHDEIREAIRKQTLMVFFLPLLAGIVHVAFAFNVINKLLAVFSFTNTGLFMLCTAVTSLLFMGFYFVVYKATVKIYFRIVRWQI